MILLVGVTPTEILVIFFAILRNLASATDEKSVQVRCRRRAPSFWSQKEPKPRLAELINANKKDKQLINKTPAENFSMEASKLAWSVQPEKFIRPELRRTVR